MMIQRLQRFAFEWKQKAAFEKYQKTHNEIIFYSESYNYWPHFEKIIEHLWNHYKTRVIYLTSDSADQIFIDPPIGVTSFCIGQSTVRTAVFVTLRAPLVVMTMPDLQVFHIKRSPDVRHYAYIFHSINSCHMVYRPRAFDFFDSVFTVGPHHDIEIRLLEKHNNSSYKRLIPHGYARLEALAKEAEKSRNIQTENKSRNILIAPSWGPNALLERHGGYFIKPLLDAGYNVILRPHPETIKSSLQMLKNISLEYGKYRNFKMEHEVASKESLLTADLMISDYSGAALEFALALLKPVLFVDVPKKINNPGYEIHKIDPVEVAIRGEIGAVVGEEALNDILKYVENLIDDKVLPVDHIIRMRNNYIHNFGKSAEVASSALFNIANE